MGITYFQKVDVKEMGQPLKMRVEIKKDALTENQTSYFFFSASLSFED